jgi:dUTP pyrophosphatase
MDTSLPGQDVTSSGRQHNGSCDCAASLAAWRAIGASLAKTNARLHQHVAAAERRLRRPYYRLKMYITPFEDRDKMNDILFMDNDEIMKQESECIESTQEYLPGEDWKYKHLVGLYEKAVVEQTKMINSYRNGKNIYFDAGFDLYCPSFNDFEYNGKVHVVDHRICCSMDRVEYEEDGEETTVPAGYYLYPRSSTGTKTPLALANSVGIIDSGYTGHIMTAFHCARDPRRLNHRTRFPLGWTNSLFQRIVQICPPDLSYPMEVVLVDSVDALGSDGSRGGGGFGSTGV